jgi:putative Holliday junction resolvase
VRVLALDIGEVRIGLAVSDAAGRIASPLKVLPADVVLNDGCEFRMLVEDWEIEHLVCGLPYTMAGEEGPQAASIKEKARQIASARDLPLSFVDERLSSAEAKRILREEGLDERSMRGKVDMIAASLFLQAWLDSHDDQ